MGEEDYISNLVNGDEQTQKRTVMSLFKGNGTDDTPEKQFIKNWLSQRKTQLKENERVARERITEERGESYVGQGVIDFFSGQGVIRDPVEVGGFNFGMPRSYPQYEQERLAGYDKQIENLENVETEYGPESFNRPTEMGLYSYTEEKSFVREPEDRSTVIHELVHGMDNRGLEDVYFSENNTTDQRFKNTSPQQFKIQQLLEQGGYDKYVRDEYDAYQLEPSEIHSRLYELRYNFDLDPNKEVTDEDIQMIKESEKDLSEALKYFIGRFDDEELRGFLNQVASNKSDNDRSVQNLFS